MAARPFQNIEYEIREGAAWITIARPDKLNALNRATVEEVSAAVELGLADATATALVLTGAGDKAFVAGADIGEMATLTPSEAQEFSRFLQRSLDRLERGRKPVIGAINGFALGGGCELALACHVRIAAENARFSQPEVNLGLIPGAGGTQRLPRIVGRGVALDMILSGEMLRADEAYRVGLVNRVVAADALRATVDAYVRNLAGKSPVALSRAIEAVVSGEECSQDEAMRLEAAMFGLCFATEDMREGTSAFLEKRKPAFRGR